MIDEFNTEQNSEKKCACHQNDQANKSDGNECCSRQENKEDGHKCSCQEESQGECKCKQVEADLISQLDLLQSECEKNKDMYLREAAAFDTYRRRMQREIAQLSKFAILPLVEDLLPVLDNLELAMSNVRQHLDSPAWAEGIELLAKQIKKVFTQHGVQEINPAVGDEFDPNLEEAVSYIKNPDIAENKIIKVVRLGYRLDDRLLRPASVVVSSGKSEGK